MTHYDYYDYSICKNSSFQFSGLLRHEIMDYMFNDPTMLEDLDFLYKSDAARKILFYYQVSPHVALIDTYFTNVAGRAG